MSNNLELFLSSPNSYENLTIEIQLDRERIAEINSDKGLDCLEIEVFGSDPKLGFLAKMPLDNFIEKLAEAKEMIKKIK